MKKYILLTVVFYVFIQIYGLINYSANPSWISSDSNQYSTGAIWADINQDGYSDLIISNGNDIQRQRVVVYYNSANGLSPTIGWQSDDIDYHGHLDAGDVNNDGFPDIVVSVYIGAQGFNSKGKAKLYLNQNGVLASTPSWISQDSFYTFACKLTDINYDGRLDLAVATGEAYYNHPDSNRVYINTGGIFENLPSWKSDHADCSYDIESADIDQNGFLDLIFVNSRTANQIYFNDENGLSNSPGWSSGDNSANANSLSIGDINNDQWLDIAVSDNFQMGSSGNFKIYGNNQGTVSEFPIWTSDFNNYGSGIEFFNNQHDQYDHLIGGGWWTALFIYENNNSNISNFYQWMSNTDSVVERIAFTDVNRDGELIGQYSITVDQPKPSIQLPHRHLSQLSSVYYNQNILPISSYTYHLENGWLSLNFVPELNSEIVVNYIYSNKLDFAVSNWGNYPNYVFYYDSNISNDLPVSNDNTKAIYVYPNPVVANQAKINLNIENTDLLDFKVALYNIKGQLVAETQGQKHTKNISLTSNTNLSSGIYIIQFSNEKTVERQKLLLIK